MENDIQIMDIYNSGKLYMLVLDYTFLCLVQGVSVFILHQMFPFQQQRRPFSSTEDGASKHDST